MVKNDQKRDTEELVKINTFNSDRLDEIDYSKDFFEKKPKNDLIKNDYVYDHNIRILQ